MSTPFSHILAYCDPCAEVKYDVIFSLYARDLAAKTFHNKQTHFFYGNFLFNFNENIFFK